jgi:hypothetical protein
MLAKRLEVLRDLAPDHTKIAILTSSAVTVQKFEAEFVEQNNLIVLKVDGGTEPDETEYEGSSMRPQKKELARCSSAQIRSSRTGAI